MDEGIDAPENLTGISNLIDVSNVNKNLKLDELERTMIGGGGLREVQIQDPDREFEESMQKLSLDPEVEAGEEEVYEEAETLDDEQPPPTPTMTREPRLAMPGLGSPNNRRETKTTTRPQAAPRPYQPYVPPQPGYPPPGQYPQQGYPPPPGQYPPQQGYPPQYTPPGQYPPQQGYPPQYAPPGYGPPRGQNGATAASQLDDALRVYGDYDAGVDIEAENEEETKGILLEDIEELLSELRGYGVDVSNVAEVNSDSTLKEIKEVHKKLQHRYDRKRCHTFGTEALMAAAHGLEFMFDGKKTYGPFRPDLTDWHNNIRPKLRRMRYETSSVVSDAMHTWNIGPLMRIAMELGISAVLHSKSRQNQRGQAAYTPDQMSSAYEDLRDFDQN